MRARVLKNASVVNKKMRTATADEGLAEELLVEAVVPWDLLENTNLAMGQLQRSYHLQALRHRLNRRRFQEHIPSEHISSERTQSEHTQSEHTLSVLIRSHLEL